MVRSKIKKLMAAALIGSMMALMVGCGKPSAKKLQDVAVKEFGAEELTAEDLRDLDEGDAQHLDDGFVLHCTGEELADEFEDELEEGQDKIDKEAKMLDKSGIDLEDIIGYDPTSYEVEDIKEMTAYFMADGVAKPESDLFTQGAVVIEFVDKKEANENMKAAMDLFVERSEIDTKGLNKGEFMYKGNKCQFVINGDRDLVCDIVVDLATLVAKKSDSGKDFDEQAKEFRKEMKEELPSDLNYVVGVYYNDGVSTVIFGVTMDDELDQISTIAKKLGVTDPTKVEMSDAMYDAIINYVDETLDKKLTKALNGLHY